MTAEHYSQRSQDSKKELAILITQANQLDMPRGGR